MKFGLFTVFDNYKNVYNRSVSQFLGEVLEQTDSADENGFDSVWYAEHHFSEYGILTSPQMLIAAAAQRTKKIRLGVSVVVLPFHDPIRIAEDYALADILSHGRLNLGLGSGYLPHEFAGFNVQGKDKAFRFNDALDVIEKAWTGEVFSHDGDYYKYENVQLNAFPVQNPVPHWIAALRPQGAHYVGKMGRNIMGIPYVSSNSIQEIKEVLDGYKTSLLEAGHDTNNRHIPLALHTYVAETREQAISDAKEHLNLYLNTRQYGKGAQFEDLEAREQLLIGTPEDVIQRIKQYEAVGMNEIMMLMNFGGLPHEKVLKSIELVSKHIIPVFKPSKQMTILEGR